MSVATVDTAAVRSPNGVAADAPDANAPVANSLAEMLKYDTQPIAKRWVKRWKRWAYFQGMTAADKEDWLRDVIIDSDDGKQKTKPRMRMSLIAASWVTETGERVAVGEKGVDMLGKLPNETVQELWEHAADVNQIREQDKESLKNGSAGGTGSAPSPDAPASTA